jgi:hypothetical protein
MGCKSSLLKCVEPRDTCKFEILLKDRNKSCIKYPFFLQDVLFFAIETGFSEGVALLYEHGNLNIDPRDMHVYFNVACYNGHLEVVKILIDKKGVDRKGGLFHATFGKHGGRPLVIRFLREYEEELKRDEKRLAEDHKLWKISASYAMS